MVSVVAVLAVLAQAPQASCLPQFAPLQTGSQSASSTLPFWRKGEAGAWGGGGWLGWTRSATAFVPVSLVVRDRPNNRGDDTDEVTVEAIPDVTFAVRCIRGLTAGPIQSTPVVNHSLTSNRSLRVSLGGHRYDIRLRSRRDNLSDAEVLLTEGQQTQVLYSAAGFADDPHFDITWAGDLDRDGRLDLIVNLSNKYSWSPYRLLLSSRAVGRQLVGEAISFETGD